MMSLITYWLRFYVPLDTKQVISETFPKPIFWLGMEKTTTNTTKAHIHQSKEMYNNKNKHKKLKPGFIVTSYDIQPGNRNSGFGAS